MQPTWAELLSLCAGTNKRERLRKVRFSVDDLQSLVPEASPGQAYGRMPIHRGPEGEVLLVRWREDQFCIPHDHGGARAVIWALRGTLTERRWSFQDGELSCEADREIVGPDVMMVGPRVIHDMKATGQGFGVHVYLPAIAEMRVYDRSARQTLTVRDDCGAWIPADAQQILAREAWAR